MFDKEFTDVNIYLFEGFETLDIFGPIEALARVESFRVKYYSADGGVILSAQNTPVVTRPITEADKSGIYVIPGGRGTRGLVHDEKEKDLIRQYAEASTYCLSICTGSAVLAKCGVLDGRRATSNKKAFEWAVSCGEHVNWIRQARWCVDGKYYTASGVSAGIDMTLGFISDLFGMEKALQIAGDMEYIWNQDADYDPFSKLL